MRRRRRRWSVLVPALGLLTAAGCAIQPDAVPRDLPEDESDLVVANPALDTSASGADRVFLVGPGDERLLRSVQREATSATDLVEILLRGPNDEEIQARYTTAIPSTTELIDPAQLQGRILTVDLTDDILELDTQTLIQAVAQIVYTVTELDSVQAVQIEIGGERLSVPTPSGSTTTEPLRIYDFPNAVQTSQPAYPIAALASNTS